MEVLKVKDWKAQNDEQQFICVSYRNGDVVLVKRIKDDKTFCVGDKVYSHHFMHKEGHIQVYSRIEYFSPDNINVAINCTIYVNSEKKRSDTKFVEMNNIEGQSAMFSERLVFGFLEK